MSFFENPGHYFKIAPATTFLIVSWHNDGDKHNQVHKKKCFLKTREDNTTVNSYKMLDPRKKRGWGRGRGIQMKGSTQNKWSYKSTWAGIPGRHFLVYLPHFKTNQGTGPAHFPSEVEGFYLSKEIIE